MDQIIVCIDGFPIRDYSTVIVFGEYIKIIDDNQRATVINKSRVTYENSCLNSKEPKAVFEYLNKLSAHVCIMDDGRKVLFNQYEKITRVSEKSELSTYLSGESITKELNEDVPIYPFGLNLSQKEAVMTALENSISIIEGPPGTGKTQTILNIIANVVAKGKSIGVVSGNNSATSNVQEKLNKKDSRYRKLSYEIYSS